MVDEQAEARDEHPVVELRVYRDGELVDRRLFESEEQAGFAMEAWADREGIEFAVDDLSVHHGPLDILEAEPGELWSDEDYRPPPEPPEESEEGA